jgi:hypothetical protein
MHWQIYMLPPLILNDIIYLWGSFVFKQTVPVSGNTTDFYKGDAARLLEVEMKYEQII